MDYILIFLFSSDKKEENFLKSLEENEEEENFNYDKYLFEFLKNSIISEEIFKNTIIEYKEIKKEKIDEKYLIFIFNISEKIQEQDFDQFESNLDIDKNLYTLLNYRNEINFDNLKKKIYKINNIEFDKNKSYKFIINIENKYIQQYKEILKYDKINEKIYFNTNFNNSIKNIIKESKTILYDT